MARAVYRMTEAGTRAFPRLAAADFEVQFHPLAPGYCRARRVGTRRWTFYAASFFQKKPHPRRRR